MATTVTSTKPLPSTGFGGGKRPRGSNGNGSHGNGHAFTPGFSPSRYRIGMWVAMAAILMMFTALTSAYIVRSGSSTDWQPLSMPRVLLLSTAVIILSSLTLEMARRKLKERTTAHRIWVIATVILGIGFLVSQLLAWRQLVAQGVYVSSNPHSSFFYVMTATHGVHLLGGLIAISFLALRTLRATDHKISPVKKQAAADVVTLYWHFMDALWIYLFILLFYWR